MAENPEQYLCAAKPKESKRYRGTQYLKECGQDHVELTFDQLANLSENGELPRSAYIHPAFWANTDTHSIALSWLAAGYEVVHTDLKNGIVAFEKVR